jgi:hypothetical protein
MSKRPSFEAACKQYPHRFTMEHIPKWAQTFCIVKGKRKFYAPHFRTDREWYEHTKFVDEPGYFGRVGDNHCYTTGQTWPLGPWLDQPFDIPFRSIPIKTTARKRRPTLNDRVLELEYERQDDHWWMVTAYGWAIDPSEDSNSALHNRSFATKREALAYRRHIEPCSCLRCTSKGTLA